MINRLHSWMAVISCVSCLIIDSHNLLPPCGLLRVRNLPSELDRVRSTSQFIFCSTKQEVRVVDENGITSVRTKNSIQSMFSAREDRKHCTDS